MCFNGKLISINKKVAKYLLKKKGNEQYELFPIK